MLKSTRTREHAAFCPTRNYRRGVLRVTACLLKQTYHRWKYSLFGGKVSTNKYIKIAAACMARWVKFNPPLEMLVRILTGLYVSLKTILSRDFTLNEEFSVDRSFNSSTRSRKCASVIIQRSESIESQFRWTRHTRRIFRFVEQPLQQ